MNERPNVSCIQRVPDRKVASQLLDLVMTRAVLLTRALEAGRALRTAAVSHGS